MSSIQTVLCLVVVLAAYGIAGQFDENAARRDQAAARPSALPARYPSKAQDRIAAVRAPAAEAASTERAEALEPEVTP